MSREQRTGGSSSGSGGSNAERIDRQLNEIEALKHIYLKDFDSVLQDPKATGVQSQQQGPWVKSWQPAPVHQFRLKLRPLRDSEVSARDDSKPSPAVQVVILFSMTALYPDKPVDFVIEACTGVSNKQKREISHLLHEKSRLLVGNEMVYELASFVSEYLSSNTVRPRPAPKDAAENSLYDDMLQRHRSAELQKRAQRIIEEEKAQQQLEADRHALNSKIELELQNKRHRAREYKEKQRNIERMLDYSPEQTNTAVLPPTIQTHNMPFSMQDFGYLDSPANPSLSRYQSDFEEVEFLGKGSFGEVVKARNRLDGRFYAVKKLLLHAKDTEYNRKLIREVTTLSRLHHAYVVRYYQAWLEGSFNTPVDESSDEHESSVMLDRPERYIEGTQSSDFVHFEYDESIHDEDPASHSLDAQESSEQKRSWADVARTDTTTTTGGQKSKKAYISGTLYIQMEYCEKNTLRDAIKDGITVDESWKYLRQICEGLAHIHSRGMIHRDLKTTNIFLDEMGDIKIGDFGLATQLELEDAFARSPTGIEPENIELTTAVGTLLYIAPELLSRGGRYNQKVDMYSLGIIFFECIYPFGTGMERVTVLRHLRQQDIKFPQGFDVDKFSNQSQIIKWLLNHDPAMRPTSASLLHSDLMPTKVENEVVEETLRMISNPSTPFFRKMIDALFSQEMDPHKDFAYDYNSGNTRLDSTSCLIFTKVKEMLVRSFTRHGAVEFQTPLLSPHFSIRDSKPGLVRLLDHDGGVLELPYNLTVPFARWVSRSDVSYLKRWCFGGVFRQNISGGQPRMVWEADFDIVCSGGPEMAHDCEVIRVSTEIMDDFPTLRQKGYYIRINHGKLIDLLFDHCQVPEIDRPKVAAIVNQLRRRMSWRQISNQILAQTSLSPTIVGQMEKYFDVTSSIELIEKKLALSDSNPIFAELKKFEKLLRSAGVTCHIILDTGLVYNYTYYRSGIIFQVMLNSKRPDIFAAGGRYDSLISTFRDPSMKTRLGCVGVNIAIWKIVTSLELSLNSHETLASERDELKLWIPSNCDVLVGSAGTTDLSDRLSICLDLWNANVKADYSTADERYTVDELLKLCRQRSITWLVLIKDPPRNRAQGNNSILKIKNIPLHREIEVRREDIVETLLNNIRDYSKYEQEKPRGMRQRHISTSVESQGGSFMGAKGDELQQGLAALHVTTASPLDRSRFEVTVLNNPKFPKKIKSGKKLIIIEKAIKKITSFLEQFSLMLSKSIQIIAVDLEDSVMKRVVCCQDVLNDSNFKQEVLDHCPELKGYLNLMHTAIVDMKRLRGHVLKSLFLYSYTTDHFEVIHLQQRTRPLQ